MAKKIVRIGGASGYWGDTALGPAQLVEASWAAPHGRAGLDYIVLDYLAEITMSVLARAKAKDAEGGYATDFIAQAMRPHLAAIVANRTKIVTNAGGLNIQACRRALEKLAADAGVNLKIGTVEGDDLMPRIEALRDQVTEMDSGAPMPARLMSANAYLGALPIAAALDAGADVVITGRCVDSALAVGPLIHEFGWRRDDYDRLAAASLAGHLIECGAQATGGNFTDWEETVGSWDDTGFPIVECVADGSFVVTKPAGTGGKVSRFTVGEQLLYEIGDPAAYLLPNVTCDFSRVRLEQDGPDRVRLVGARGWAPGGNYKVSATFLDGFSSIGSFVVAGRGAAARAGAQGEAILKRTRRMMAERGLPDFFATAMQVIGTESLYGHLADPALAANREVVLRLAVHHPLWEGAELFSREFAGSGLSMAPGLTMLSPGRPKPSPVVRLYSFLVGRKAVDVEVQVGGAAVAFEAGAALDPPASTDRGRAMSLDPSFGPAQAGRPGAAAMPTLPGNTVQIPLRLLAVARSGDKGDKANIGVMARRPEFIEALRTGLTAERVKAALGHLARGDIARYELPGIGAFNFVLDAALGGGGIASLNLDPQGKTYAQMLLDQAVPVDAALARSCGLVD